ncbi:hypothetical protein M885DRAFT_16678 [Pelagophyceae sp. CCMP2097]|nr:hypothetical protein M885DRAFT_16678 [Pelagophyceae sp. CCMP2097]
MGQPEPFRWSWCGPRWDAVFGTLQGARPFDGASRQRDSTAPLVASAVLCCILLEAYRRPAILTSFWLLIFLKCVRSASNGVGTLVDALTLRVLERHDGAGYGAQRLWTGLAWGLGSFVVGVVIDRHGYGAIFTWSYASTALLLVLLACRPDAPASRKSVEDPNAESATTPRTAASANLRAYGSALLWGGCAPGLRTFLAVMVLYGCAMSLVQPAPGPTKRKAGPTERKAFENAAGGTRRARHLGGCRFSECDLLSGVS